MSFTQSLLNRWLRAVEKRRLRNGSPATLRRALELQARLFFHAPRGTSQSWVSFGGVDCKRIAARHENPDRIIFYIHGGGFVFGSPDTHSALVGQLVKRLGAWAVLPRYRLAPEGNYPAAPDDIRAVWNGLLAEGVKPENVVIGGDSAGGALAFGLVATLLAEGAALPGAVFGFSPLTDLTFSGASLGENADRDVVLPAERAAEMATLFLQGAPADNPSVSPLFGDFNGSPPAWITVGDTEILYDDARRLAERLKGQGVKTELTVENDLPHVWPLFHNVLPEGRQTLDNLSKWIRQQQNWEA
ncbi:alpha/beta hydrolase [Sulfitobacter donghicola]|uniref:Esterase n=1 Tax=Sulfitobacter donghicola DSW-25 = KCTC 12864 = JCM 14565 TaxID=1300350 RepID=A0A073IH48_9RHOB|nr:alpha/beta hydrolase [Sulfitobacter donghicola]KEJ89084.1 esterase [Sulfitobacter donghicola DSW-25 = KCTC 12864 = JCM 14565]KIN67340.1 Acetyl-hydrolase [Sulfitobacter donghicola DSW-25 = KCTC 12864 = JCM 14565]